MNSIGNISFCGNKKNYELLDKCGFEIPLNAKTIHKNKTAKANAAIQEMMDNAHFEATMHNPTIPKEQKAVIAQNRTIVGAFKKLMSNKIIAGLLKR